MKKVYKVTLKSLLFIVLSFCVFNIISSYAAEPIFKISSISVKEKSTGVTVNDVDLNNDEIINDVVFTDVNDYITYNLKLKNTSSDEYTIKSIDDNNTSEYLKYTYDNLSNTVLSAGSEKEFNLTITYIKQATDPNLSTTETNLIITYEKVGGDEEQEEVTPSVNPDSKGEDNKGGSPKTSDNVTVYFIIGTASILGLILLSKNKKKTKTLVIIGLFLVPLCVSANTLKLTVKFSNNIKAISYDVEIDLGNESNIIYKSLAKGAKLTKPEDPTKRGYKFDNWYLNNDIYDFDTVITAPISLEARYTKETYEISYDLDGGSLGANTNPTEYDVDSDITLFNPTKQGYDFVGWRLKGSTDTVLNVHIKDEVGKKSYKAIYTPKTDTPYTVTHKYRHLNDNGFDVVIEENTVGTTGAVIEVDYRVITGFKTPTIDKHLTILADGSAEKVYEYERETYDFILTDTDNVTSDTVNGNYPYGKVINLTANSIDGYTFTKWSNDVTTNPYQITLTDDVTISPVYTANTDTPYTVKHKYQHIDDDDFDEVVESNTVGTTDTIINIPYQTLEGFIEPTTSQSLKILGDGSAEKEYEYVRETYSFTLNDITNLVTSSVSNNTYRYGKEITLIAGEKTGCTFVKWSNNVTTSTYTFNLTSDVTISPIYTCTVTFDPNNGGSTTSIEVEYGKKVDSPANPSKDGYTFNYWKLNDSQYDFANTTVTGPITLVAEYTANGDTPYTVKHRYQHIDDDGYDEVVEPNTTGTTDDTITVPYQTLEGFVEPTTSQSLTITGDGEATKIYEYERKTHTFTLNDITNLVTSSVPNNTYRYGKEITLTAGSKQGCTFVKWSNDQTNSTYTFDLTSDVTISPIYTCTVSIDPNNGDNITYQSVNYGSKITRPSSDPEKTGYTFNYWTNNNQEYDFDTLITGEVNLVASYTLDTYSIEYVLDGGTFTGEYPQSYDYEHSVNLPTPSKQGYDFDGWMVTGTSEIISPEIAIHSTGNKSFTAHYTSRNDTQYKVIRRYQNINDDNYTEDAPEIYYGTTDTDVTIAYNTPTGFNDPSVSTTLTITGDGEATKVFEYDRVKYTYTFNNMGYNATSTLPSGEYKHGTVITLNAGLEDAYTFSNWSNNVTTNPYEFTLTSNLTISPVYNVKTYTVSFVTGTSDVIPNQTIEYGEKATIPGLEPSKEGYGFDYWTLNDQEYDFDLLVTSDIELNAHYTIEEYDITYNLDGGSLEPGYTNPETYTINSNITLNNPSKEGYTFTGWTKDSSEELITTVNIVNQTGDVTYTAHYVEHSDKPIICKKATSLHTETCLRTDGSGCRNSSYGKYAYGDTITYGNIINSDTFESGDAFDCNVDGTGYNQRFYYLTTTDNKAILISNTNYEGEAKQQTQNIFYYDVGLTKLPDTSDDQWNNLPITFDYGNGVIRAARYPYKSEIEAACNNGNEITIGAGKLSSCKFLFENSRYSSSSLGRTATWIYHDDSLGSTYYRYSTTSVGFETKQATDNSQNAVRPVIEVPLDQIEDSYVVKFILDTDTNTNNYIYRTVVKGSPLGSLPEYSEPDYSVVNWYRDSALTQVIDENRIPTGYETYYSLWKLNADHAIYATKTYKLANNTTSQIVVLNSDDVEPLIYTSNDESIVTVDSEGALLAHSVGTTTVKVEGSISHTYQTVDVIVSEDTPKVTVSFDTHGGTPVDDMVIDINTAIGNMPTTTLDGYTFVGWFNNAQYAVEIKGDNEILADLTLHAKWMPSDTVCEMNNTYYSSIQAAIDAAPTTKTTITLVKDVQLSAYLDMFDKNTNKNIVIDLNGYTLSNASNATSIRIIRTKGTLEFKNGDVRGNNLGEGAVDVNGANARFIMNSGSIITTGIKPAIYNEGGTVEIGGTAYISSKAKFESGKKRGTIQTLTSGTAIITGGTIVNAGTDKGFALAADTGTIIIGTKDGDAIDTNPIIIGNTYGVRFESTANVYFYDGIIKAFTNLFESTVLSDSSNIEEGYKTETGVDSEGYKFFHLVNSDYIIQLNAKGGDVSPTYVTVEPGQLISYLPTPTKGVYTFDGWYYDEGYNNPVDLSIAPTQNTTYYAKWVYNATDEIVEFNINSNAMKSYFNNVSTWVNGATSSDYSAFSTSMNNNFTANSCSACCVGSDCDGINNCNNQTSGNYCEQSIGYNTEITSGITVRESNETTKIKNGNIADYVTVTNGVIYNMIPGTTYYWESNQDVNVHGYVKATGQRRTIYSTVRNVRDLGGLATSFIRNNVTKTGTINYGRLYRGAQLSNGQTDVNSLTKLGITREIDLRQDGKDQSNPARLPKHDKSNSSTVTSDQDIIITNYLVNPSTHMANYKALRDALKTTMEYIVNDNDENIYFHCTIGTDRTGTLAYFLEGLLGVSEEDRLEDYEITYYYGLLNRTRFHDNLSGSSINPRFYSMYNTYKTNEQIYDFYMYGLANGENDLNNLSKSQLLSFAEGLGLTGYTSSNTESELITAIEAQLEIEDSLVQSFRDKMITYNN